MDSIEKRLTGGHPNSLGNTIEVVEEVLANHELLEELFNCYFSADEVVRLRTSNALKRISQANRELLLPYLGRLLNDISKIDQASTKWTLAQLFLIYTSHFTTDQLKQGKDILKENLTHENDWIVLNMTIETLANWARQDDELKEWLVPRLVDYSNESRKSIANKANKWLTKLEQ